MVARDLHNPMVVATPGWDGGAHVRIVDAHPAGPDRIWVLWEDAHGGGIRQAVEVPAGMNVTLISAGHRRCGR
jgi:hypothetical protein